jgi:hypothetical protein
MVLAAEVLAEVVEPMEGVEVGVGGRVVLVVVVVVVLAVVVEAMEAVEAVVEVMVEPLQILAGMKVVA